MFDVSKYALKDPGSIITPQMLYYTDYIEKNIEEAIRIAKNPAKMWPHVKTHKTREITLLCIEKGVTRFKCATIAEAEAVASCRPTDIILAHPLVGPNIERFLNISEAFPDVRFYSIGDDKNAVKKVADAAAARKAEVRFLADVNCGQNRTGVTFEKLPDFYETVNSYKGLKVCGLHCYDGHIHQSDLGERKALAADIIKKVYEFRDGCIAKGLCCDTITMGGTPTFPIYAGYEGVYCSPGTVFVNDYNYFRWYKDMNFTPAGIILSRVISRPTADTFTIDCGYKAIGADPDGVRGCIIGMEDFAEPQSHSEEHWVIKVKLGFEDRIPEIGSEVYVMPSHICSSNDRYPFALTVSGGSVTGHWDIAARNRRICF